MNGPVISFSFAFLFLCFIPLVWRLLAWLLLFHLSYYNISSRIATLTSFIEQGEIKGSKDLKLVTRHSDRSRFFSVYDYHFHYTHGSFYH